LDGPCTVESSFTKTAVSGFVVPSQSKSVDLLFD